MNGKKFGRLTIIEEKRNEKNHIYYICKCDCGNIKSVNKSNLISGRTKSCGCYQKEKLREIYTKRNKFYEFDDYIKGITNNTNAEFYIDKEDYLKVKDICWYESSNGYIMHKDSKKRVIQLHRFIMNPPKGLVVDHINHNRKDNRKNNLKICTQKENCLNRKEKAKGITKAKRNNNIYYIVQLRGKYIGCFKDLNEAEKVKKEIERNYIDD